MLTKTIKSSSHFAGISLFLIGIVILAVSASVSPLQACRKGETPGTVFEITPQVLKSLIDSDPNLYMVDVRTKNELKELKKIDQSINIPLSKLKQNKWVPPEEDKTLVFICRTGRRSLIAAGLIAHRGCTVYSLKGGLVAWYDAIKPVPRNGGEKQEKDQEEPPDVIDMGC